MSTLNKLDWDIVKSEFDEEFYLEQRPDVAKAGIDPLVHYLVHGWKEGSDPHPEFSVSCYLDHNPDLKESGIEPFSRWLLIERKMEHPTYFSRHFAKRLVAAEFDGDFYLKQCPDVAEAKIDPLEHYILKGWKEGFDPNREFSVSYYLDHYPDVKDCGVEPFSHWLLTKRKANHFNLVYDGRCSLDSGIASNSDKVYKPHPNPTASPSPKHLPDTTLDDLESIDPWLMTDQDAGHGDIPKLLYSIIDSQFDKNYYKNIYPDISKIKDPVKHFILHGWKEGRNPSPHFSTRGYADFYNLSHKDGNPLIDNAIRILRKISDLNEHNFDVIYKLTEALFDREFYLNTYHDVKQSKMDPVRHYMVFGWLEKRNPTPYFSTDQYIKEHNLSPNSINPLAHHIINLAKQGEFFYSTHNKNTGHAAIKTDYETNLYRLLSEESGVTAETTLHKQRRFDLKKPVVFIVFFCQTHTLTNLQRSICKEYLKLKVNVVAILNQNQPISPADAHVPKDVNYIVTRSNSGFDFGAWADAISSFDDLSAFPRVILTNDSLVPLSSGIKNIITLHLRTPFDWTFTTVNLEVSRHGQSFLMSFNPLRIGHTVLELIKPPFHCKNKQDVINGIEIPLSENIEKRGFSVGYLFEETDYAPGKEFLNPTLHSAQEIIRKGFCFAKSEFLLENFWDPSSPFNEWFTNDRLSEIQQHFESRYPNRDYEKNIAHFVPSGDPVERRKLILFGHNAHVGGAQTLLLMLAKSLIKVFNYEIIIVLHEEGKLLGRFKEIAPTFVIRNDKKKIHDILSFARSHGFSKGIINTAVPLVYAQIIYNYLINIVCLIHELPITIEALGLQHVVKNTFPLLDSVVFPSESVREQFLKFLHVEFLSSEVLHQGHFRLSRTADHITNNIDFKILNSLNKHKDAKKKLILCVGTIEKRKGFDTFCAAARGYQNKPGNNKLHFVWVGSALNTCDVSSDLKLAYKNENITIVPNTDIETLGHIYELCDIYYFTSRVDPMPYSVVDALFHGMPVVGYEGVGGCDELIERFGTLLKKSDDIPSAMQAICSFLKLNDKGSSCAATRIQHIESFFDFDDYVCNLTRLLGDYNPKVSVVVPNYNHEKHLPIRIRSILDQTYRYFDLVLLDDYSSDNSREILKDASRQHQRYTQLSFNDSNSGNSYKQWQKGFTLSKNELVWIAESDDACSRSFLAHMTKEFHDHEVNVGFSHTQFIDEEGKRIGTIQEEFYSINSSIWNRSYKISGKHEASRALSKSNTMINVSSVIFRAAAVPDFERVLQYRFAGDWELYLMMCSKGKIFFNRDATNYFRRSSIQQTSQVVYTSLFYKEHKMIMETVREFFGPLCAAKTEETIRYHWNKHPILKENIEKYLAPVN